MTQRRKYMKKPDAFVTAVRLDLETEGFSYEKWGETQRCKAGDWIVDNAGDVYTIDGQEFAATYRETSPGRYAKVAPVWAERATQAGVIRTREGATRYAAGAYLVYTDPEGDDGYAVEADAFERMYEPAP